MQARQHPARNERARRQLHSLTALAPIASACLFFTCPAGAIDWGAEAAAGVLRTDNLLRTDTAPMEASVREVSTNFTMRESTRRLDLDASGSVIYRNYDVDGISDDTLPTLNAFLQWTVAPERFAWIATDNFGQRALNPNDSLLPSDRENLNVAGTGPELQLPIGGDSWVTVAGRYSQVDYQRSPLDNTRTAGRVGFEHELDAGRFWSVNYSYAHTEFQDTPSQFDIQSVYLGYVIRSSKGTLDANVGVTDLDDTVGSHSGYLADVRLERELSAHTSVSLDAVHRYGDTADVFRRQQDLDPDIETTADVIATDQALRETSASLSFGWTGRRTRMVLGGQYFSERFFNQSVSANRSGTGLFVLGEMSVSPTVQIQSRFEWRRDAPEFAETNRLAQGRVNLLWQASRTLGLSLGAEHYLRDGVTTTAGISGSNNYNETRYFAQLVWQMRALDAGHMRPRIDTPASRRVNTTRETF